MKNVRFIYMNNNYEIKVNNENMIINNLLYKYVSILKKEIKQLYFIYKGKYLSLNNNKRMNEIDDNNLIIFVFDLYFQKHKSNNDKNKELKHIICPECKNLAIINYNNDLFSLNCNKHKFNNFTINLFLENQYFHQLNINCDICKNNKIYYDKFYKCINRKNICPLCIEKYKIENTIIDYDYRFYFCNKHNNRYISYCKNCNINLCNQCENEHSKHKYKSFKEIKPNNKRIEEVKKEKMIIKSCKDELMILKKIFNTVINSLIDDLDKYMIIYNYLNESFQNLCNYESINNFLNFNLKTYFNDINYILNENNIINKYKKILNIYDNKKNEMTIIYKNINKIKLFGKLFVNNNKGNCYLVINNREYNLIEYISLDNNKNKGNITIKLIEN